MCFLRNHSVPPPHPGFEHACQNVDQPLFVHGLFCCNGSVAGSLTMAGEDGQCPIKIAANGFY